MKTMHEIKDESQEIGPYVVVVQPRRSFSEPAAQNFDGHIGLHVDMHGYSHGFCNIEGEVVDVARNYLFEQCIQTNAKYVLSIGDDTVIPFDGFLKLHKVAEENPDAVVAGVYYIKLSSPMIMVMENNYIKIPNVDPGQVIEAWMIGLDCVLIPMHILKKMKETEPELPFCCIGNNIEGIAFVGEDNFFYHRLHKLGFRILVNTDVQCLHMDNATGKYTAHPSVDLDNYITNIPITNPLTWADKKYIDHRWTSRAVKPLNQPASEDKAKNDSTDYSNETKERLLKALGKTSECTQRFYELACLCEQLSLLKPETVLEIGIDHGGTLQVWSEFSADNAMLIGVDNDPDVKDIKYVDVENKNIVTIVGDSQRNETIELVKNKLGDRKVDFLFIDGDHRELAVRNDFINYSKLVRPGGIIAFHDINASKDFESYCVGVKKVWEEIKENHPSAKEFVDKDSEIHYGIGMLVV